MTRRRQRSAGSTYFPPFCNCCGERLPPLEPSAIACPSCAGDLVPRHLEEKHGLRRKNDAMTAGLLSLLVPGAGQVFNGHFFRGLMVFGTCWLIIPWIFGVIDAYGDARRAELATNAPQIS